MGYIIAKYIRLSIEDAKSESMSIENQCLLLDTFIDTMEEPDIEVMEFVDNGFSGTTLERPALQELFELVRSGAVNCIIVKDFSRLGRDAVEAGYLLERVFPLFKTRFISITDIYDSAEHDGDTGGLSVAFRLLLSERYSRDLSKKIKASRHEKAIRGEAVSTNCIYGYKKVGRRMEVDEPAAETVRLIFDLAANSSNLNQIVAVLYNNKVPSITEYKSKVEDCKCIWTTLAVHSIIYEEQYIGTYTAGKSARLSVGSSRAVKVDKSEWIKIPNHHPAIVSEEVFRAAQEGISIKPAKRKREIGTSQRYGGIERPLKGKVVCGCCERKMRLNSTRNATFQCMYTFSIHDAPCYRLRISNNDLSDIMLDAIRQQAVIIMDSDKPDAASGSEAETASLLSGKKEKVRKLYEKLVRKEIRIDQYRDAKDSFIMEINRLSQIQANAKHEAARNGEIQKIRSQFIELTSAAGGNWALTTTIIDLLVEKIKIFPDGKIVAEWRHPNLAPTEIHGAKVETSTKKP